MALIILLSPSFIKSEFFLLSNSNSNIFICQLNLSFGSSFATRQIELSQKLDFSTALRKLEDQSLGRITPKPLTCKTYETPKTTSIKNDIENEALDGTIVVDGSRFDAPNELTVKDANEMSSSPRLLRKSDPPPLPPKPKYLPPKSTLWGQNNFANRAPQEITNRNNTFLKPSEVKRDARVTRSRRAIYLDQPSSSFV